MEKKPNTKSIRFAEKELKNNEVEQYESDEDVQEKEDEENDEQELGSHFNKFQLLEFDDNHEAVDIDDEVENIQCETDSDSNISHKPTQQSKSSSQAKPNKKSKKRNKARSSKIRGEETLKNVLETTSTLQEENFLNCGSKEANSSQPKNNCQSQLLKLDMRNLIAENELKRMFGKSVLKEERYKEQKSSRHYHLTGPNSQQRSRFVSYSLPNSRALAANYGPKMEPDDLLNQQTSSNSSLESRNKPKDISKGKKKTPDSVKSNENPPTYFKFVHDKPYQLAHFNFLNAAQQGNSNAIIRNVNLHPTHVESLLQLSDMIRISEDFKTAADLVERCLLIFEKGFHQRFNLSSPTCQLSYKRPENRTFFITLFKHINYCNRRGLRKTPLEYTKLLLSLDPVTDPLFAALLIDFYAIRSEEYDYLIDFVSCWSHMSKLPNMQFSRALAYFMKSRCVKQAKEASADNLKLADDYLKEALLKYPNFIIPLLDECNAEPSGELKQCSYFDYSVYSNKYKFVPESVDLLVNLYVQRNCNIWKNKNVLGWLERNVAELVEKFSKKELVDYNRQISGWADFGTTPRSLLRHILLSDLKLKIPTNATSSELLDIDPFPPNDSIISYTRDSVISPIPNDNQNALSTDTYGIRTFVRSILPSFRLDSSPNTPNHPHEAILPEEYMNPENWDPATRELIEDQIAQAMLENGDEVNGPEGGLNLDRVHSSIQNVLSSLTNLLIGNGEQNLSNRGNNNSANNNNDERDNRN